MRSIILSEFMIFVRARKSANLMNTIRNEKQKFNARIERDEIE